MSNTPLTFEARPAKAAKDHKCWACLSLIPKGEYYICYPGKNNSGKFQSTKLCTECSFLLPHKTGATANTIRQGEFSERLIPNFLRKKRNGFRADPRKALEEAGLLLEKLQPTPPKPCSQIVVKTSEFDRRIFHLPESRYKAEQFAKGASLTVKAGVTGKARTAIIKGAWSVDGSGFGCNKRQVAVFVA